MKRNIIPKLLILVSATLITGCGQQTDGGSNQFNSSVAIVDLDKVAASTGRDQQFNEAIKEKETELNAQLAAERAAAEKQVAEKQTEIGEDPSDQQKAELQAFKLQATRRVLASQQQAKNQLVQLRAQLIGEFRTEILPVATRIAQEQRIKLVLAKNDSIVLAFDQAIDITESVADGMSDVDTSDAP